MIRLLATQLPHRITPPAIIVVALLAVQFHHAHPALAEPSGKPNFVIIMADDMGYAGLSCYGNPYFKTPHLDRLAKEGLKFTDFHSSGAVCSPTRAGLVTGRYQQRTGVDGVVNADPKHPYYKRGLAQSEVTFANVLGEAGYATGLFGKWHFGYLAQADGRNQSHWNTNFR